MNNIWNHLNSIRRIWCFSYSFSTMALPEREFMSDDDPWKVSAFVSAIVELFLSILLLLCAAIAFITSRFAKLFGLEPPCTYIGCSHPLHSESVKCRIIPTFPSWKSKDLCRDEFCANCQDLRIHAKVHSNIGSIREAGSGSEHGRKRTALGSRHPNATDQDPDVSSCHNGEFHETCSCSHSPLYKKRNQRKGPKCTVFVCAASSSTLHEDPPFLSSRSGSEITSKFHAEDHREIFQAPADSKEEWQWKGTYLRRENNSDSDLALAHHSEHLERNVASEELDEKACGISPSLFKSSASECAELLPSCGVHDEVEELKVSRDSFEQGKQEDNFLAVNLGGNIQAPGNNISESEEDTQPLEPSSQEILVERLPEASLDNTCENDGMLSEGEKGVIETNFYLEQGELVMKDHGKGVKTVLNEVAIKNFSDESASTNAMAQCGWSVAHVEEKMSCSMPLLEVEDDEEDFIQEDEQEEGLDALKLALQAERSVLAALEAELENERNAAAVATSEAMAMISRLQEEKSAMQMQVAQLQRMSEEKANYDEQAMALLKEVLFKREKENIALEKEVEMYRGTLSVKKADELKRSWLSEGTESFSPQSLKPLLLTGAEEEFLLPVVDMNQKQASAFSEEYYQSGTERAPWIQQSGLSPDLEELNRFSLDQKMNKRSTDFPMSDTATRMSFKLWDDEGRSRHSLDGGLPGPYSNSDQLKREGRSAFSTNDEEAQCILERLWVLEEELQKLHGKDGLSKSEAHEAQGDAISATYRRAEKSITETSGDKSKEQREEVEVDGVAEAFVPIHDVYEVQSTTNFSPPFAEERDPPEDFEGTSGNSEPTRGSISESFSPARMTRHKIQRPPRMSPAKTSFPSDEPPCTSVLTPQAAGWIIGKCSHPEDLCNHQDLQAQSLIIREERSTTKEEIHQLAVRLKALEEDRELLRDTLESLKHRDTELTLLQEIAQHLRDLRMAGFMKFSRCALLEDRNGTSPSKNRALKKRRYSSGQGHAQMRALHQKNIELLESS